jgi:hypothetical protein
LTLFHKVRAPEERVIESDAICRVALADRLTVDVDGRLYACATLAESYQELPSSPLAGRLRTLRMGQVGDPEALRAPEAHLAAVFETGLFHGKRNKHSSLGRCGDCPHLGACTVCPVSIIHQPGNDDPDRIPDFICAFNQAALGWRERFPAEPSASNLLGAAIRNPDALV